MILWIYPGQWQLELAMAYCALLLPLIVGLPPLLAIMESVFVMTEREIWKQMARFWGKLFGIALYPCTLGAILLVAGYFLSGGAMTRMAIAVFSAVLLTLFVEIFLFRRFWRDWWHRSRLQHLLATLFLALMPNAAILAVAAMGGWTANAASIVCDSSTPISAGGVCNALLSPVSQLRFVHLTSACYLTAATLLLSISAWYLLRNRNVGIARRSMTVAASLGLAAALSLAVRGGTLNLEGSAYPLLMLWSFRVMIVLGMCLVVLFAAAFYLASRRRLNRRIFLHVAVWSFPLPWFGMALGWVTTEIRGGRWNAAHLSGITVAQGQLTALIFGFIVLVAILVGATQMLHVVRGGPERLKLWPTDAGGSASN